MAISKSCSAQWLIPGTCWSVSSLQRNSMGRRAGVPSVKPMSRGCCFLFCWGFQLWHRHVTQLRAKVGLPLRKREQCAFGSSRASSFPAAPAAVLLLANSLSSSSCSWPRSPAQPRFSLLPCVPAPSRSIILTQHLCQQPWGSPFLSGFGCPLPPAPRGPGVGAGSGIWDTALSHTSHLSQGQLLRQPL